MISWGIIHIPSIYPLVNTRFAIEMAIEIVDLPSYKMVIFHSYVNVYQRVTIQRAIKGYHHLWKCLHSC